MTTTAAALIVWKKPKRLHLLVIEKGKDDEKDEQKDDKQDEDDWSGFKPIRKVKKKGRKY